MMNKLLTVLGLFIASHFGYSQDFNLSFSAFERLGKDASGIVASTKQDNVLFALKYADDEELEFVAYDLNSLKIIKRRVIMGGRKTTSQMLSDNFSPIDLISLNKRLYLLVESFEKSEQKSVLLAQEISQKGDFVGKLKAIDEIQVERKSNRGGFGIELSPDTTQLLVISSPPYHKKQKEKFLFKTFDADLNALKKLAIDLPHSDKAFHFHQALISRKGNIVFSGYYELDRKDTKRDHEEEKMVVYIIEPSGVYKDYEISIPKLELTNIHIGLHKTEELLYINGLYRNLADGKKDELAGIVSVTINLEDKSILSKKVSPFTREFVAKVKDEKLKNINSNEGIPAFYRAVEYLPNNDGTMWALLEERYSVTNKYGTIYHFNEIVALHLNKEGEIEHSIYIPKQQIIGYKSYSIGSFYTCHTGDDLFLILNDHEDNISPESKTLNGIKKQSNASNTCLYSIELKTDGSFVKSKLYNNSEKVCLVTNDVKLDDRNILFEVREFNALGIVKDKESSLCKLTITQK
jgi:hypothetical protein